MVVGGWVDGRGDDGGRAVGRWGVKNGSFKRLWEYGTWVGEEAVRQLELEDWGVGGKMRS